MQKVKFHWTSSTAASYISPPHTHKACRCADICTHHKPDSVWDRWNKRVKMWFDQRTGLLGIWSPFWLILQNHLHVKKPACFLQVLIFIAIVFRCTFLFWKYILLFFLLMHMHAGRGNKKKNKKLSPQFFPRDYTNIWLYTCRFF